MKLSELRPCAGCGGALVAQSPIFYVVKSSPAILDKGATDETLGLSRMFGGSLALAEVMGARAEDAVFVVADDKKSNVKWERLFLCGVCYFTKPIGSIEVPEEPQSDTLRPTTRKEEP